MLLSRVAPVQQKHSAESHMDHPDKTCHQQFAAFVLCCFFPPQVVIYKRGSRRWRCEVTCCRGPERSAALQQGPGRNLISSFHICFLLFSARIQRIVLHSRAAECRAALRLFVPLSGGTPGEVPQRVFPLLVKNAKLLKCRGGELGRVAEAVMRRCQVSRNKTPRTKRTHRAGA